jgi:V-type H+-transporting ATPase subunit e
MAGVWLTFVIVTGVWLAVGGVGPLFVRAGPNKGVIQTMIVMTAASCYLFWLCTILMQLNPLIGPEMTNTAAFMVQQQW